MTRQGANLPSRACIAVSHNRRGPLLGQAERPALLHQGPAGHA